jgi:gliding motility-associated-like protein
MVQWNDAAKSFGTIPFKTESGSSSTANDLDEGGYKVQISDLSGYDTSMVSWIFFDKPPIAEARLQQQLCDRIALHGDTAATTQRFFYNDIYDGSSVSLKNEITFLWSSDPISYIPSPDYYLNPIIVNVPLPEREYRLPLEDVTSIHVKADFSVDPNKGEAPLEVSFTDKSVRGTLKYTWEFDDNTSDGKKRLPWVVESDSLWLFESPFTHTYFKPGEYSVNLTIESVLHCIDSMRFNKIVVDDSDIKIPNVFTPDGDGLNDYFIPELISLRYINVEVFSRSGKLVYSFYGEGETLKDWKGWDGNINNTSIKASPGVYFYIIHAFGWDDIDYNSKLQRGFVYLYR